MENGDGVHSPLIIAQDDQSEVHVQVVMQSGRRQLDIRVWRRGPTGFAPSRNALTLEEADLRALREGIGELLEASSGGQQVARVVWDKDEGRRLRAETEPFGTRFVARLGFWQRVRDTWRPAGDGLVVTADRLDPLLGAIRDILPRLHDAPLDPPAPEEVGFHPASLQRWPTPGADWFTADPDRLAFHPRGVRVTATVEQTEAGHRLALQQWRRQETLWLPEEAVLLLDVPAIDALLMHLQALADGEIEVGSEPVARPEDGNVRVLLTDGGCLVMEAEEEDGTVRTYVSIPADQLTRFGRLLAQAGLLLITRLTEGERTVLQTQVGEEIAPTIISDAIAPAEEDEEAADEEGGADGEVTEEIPVPSPALAPEPTRRLTPLGELRLGRHAVFLYLQEDRQRQFSYQWDGYTLLIPVDRLSETLAELRDLYYEALRGRRGSTLTAGDTAGVRMSVHNQGQATTMVLEQEVEGRAMRLAFPVTEVPTFLNVTGAAMKKASAHE